ncbi:hypothetical protein ABID22_001003 [Pontibacter aydingkolensis]
MQQNRRKNESGLSQFDQTHFAFITHKKITALAPL